MNPIFSLLILMGIASSAFSQGYPSKPVSLVIPFGAGGEMQVRTVAPDVPTAREAGVPDMEKIVGWTALMGPPGLPKDVVERWSSALANLAKDPEWLAAITKIGGIPAIRSAADTEKYVREQYELYDKLIGTLGIRQ